MKRSLTLLFLLVTTIKNISAQHYICTASDEKYFPCLINLIGSLHKNAYDDFQEIAVFDLGLNQNQLQFLRAIKKVNIYQIEITHPDLLTPYKTTPWGKMVPGWYAWKAVIVKQGFDLFGMDAVILWVDAGTTILKSLDPLFEHIKKNGYFFHNGSHWPLNKETTTSVKEKLQLNKNTYSWILLDTTFGLEAGFMGVTQSVYDSFVLPMYRLTFDLTYFEDDGTCPGGFGNSRHDLTLFSLMALFNNYTIHHHFENPNLPVLLDTSSGTIPFGIACIPEARSAETAVYCARFDVNPADYFQSIHYKQ